MPSFKMFGAFLASCVFHGGIAVAAFAFSSTPPVVSRDAVYRVALVPVGMPLNADAARFSPFPTPDPPLPAPDRVAAARQKNPAGKSSVPVKKVISARKKEEAPKPLAEEPSARHGMAEVHTASAEATLSDSGPPLRHGGLAAYGEDAVDQPPSVTVQATPEYPSRARRMGIEGQVEVRLIVDSAGRSQACTVHKTDPTGYFEAAALAAARKTRFHPGMLRGRPVNTLVHMSFTFVLR